MKNGRKNEKTSNQQTNLAGALNLRLARKQAKLADGKVAREIAASGDGPALAILGGKGGDWSGARKIEVHRLYLYSNLPLQEAGEDHRLRTRNGLAIRDMDSVMALARMAGLSLGEMSRKYAERS